MIRLVLVYLLICHGVGANGVLRWGFGARDTGAAGAFGGTRGDALAAVHFNPALLSRLPDRQWVLSTRLLAGDATFRRAGVTSRLDGAQGAYPDLAFAWHPADSSWTLGLGASPIAALQGRWDYLDAPGGLGNISYGRVPHESRFTAMRLALALSWQVSRDLSLGMSAGAIRSEIDFDAPFIFQTNPALAGAKVDLDLNTEGWAPSFELGAHYQAHPNWSFGGRLKLPVALDNSGSTDVDFSAQLPAFTRAGYRAHARTELPLTVGLGASWQIAERWSLGLWVDWHRWSASYDTFKVDLSNGSDAAVNAALGPDPSDRIPLNWDDRFVFALGTSYQIAENWTLRAGYRYGKSPIPNDLVTPLNGATLEQALTLGLGWQSDDWRLDLAYGYEFTDTSRVGRSGYRAGEYSNSAFRPSLHLVSLSLGRSF